MLDPRSICSAETQVRQSQQQLPSLNSTRDTFVVPKRFSCPRVASSSQQTPVPLIVGHASSSHVVSHWIFGVLPRIFPSDGTYNLIFGLTEHYCLQFRKKSSVLSENDPCLIPLSTLIVELFVEMSIPMGFRIGV